MALPRFFDRIADAALPFMGDLERGALASHLQATTVRLRASQAIGDSATQSAGFLLAANLLARFYPRIVVEGPTGLADQAQDLMRAINPEIDLDGVPTLTLAFSPQAPKDEGVTVIARGWNVATDGAANESDIPAAPPAALAAAAIGASELFRMVFADLIPQGRHGPEPGSLNLVTLQPWSDVTVPALFDIGIVHLAGAGAVGEAAIEALRVTSLVGGIIAVDPERVEDSNLQRYVLTRDSDIGVGKTTLVTRALKDTNVSVKEVPTRWGEDERSAPCRRVVLSALDTGEGRVGIQAGLHGRIYNAFTQPADLGWSRHESFGVGPCLACLYWPSGPKPHRYQVIAAAVKQPELRVRGYLASGVAVGAPLPTSLAWPVVDPPPAPEEIERWLRIPILHDLAEEIGLNLETLDQWATLPLDNLYRGMCAGTVVRLPTGSDTLDVAVPLAHQSALAGVMLAVQLLISCDDTLLAHRPSEIEGRYDVMRRIPPTTAIPSGRSPGCLCSDADFVDSWKPGFPLSPGGV